MDRRSEPPFTWLKWKTSCSKIEAHNRQNRKRTLEERVAKTYVTSQNGKEQKKVGVLHYNMD